MPEPPVTTLRQSEYFGYRESKENKCRFYWKFCDKATSVVTQ